MKKQFDSDGLTTARFIMACLDRLGRGDSVRQIEEDMEKFKNGGENEQRDCNSNAESNG